MRGAPVTCQLPFLHSEGDDQVERPQHGFQREGSVGGVGWGVWPASQSQRERRKNKVNSETGAAEETRQLQKKGRHTQIWAPSAHPNACLFPKRPNRAWPKPAEQQKEE